MQNSIAESDDSGIPFANDSTRTPAKIKVERDTVLNFYGIALGLQVAEYVLTYVMTPGYIVPLLNQPVARLLILLIFFWQIVAAGAHWYLAPTTNRNKTALQLPILLFIYAPGYLMPMLGPACIAIFGALGPIMSTK